jgi:small subunit ribosomal protein S6
MREYETVVITKADLPDSTLNQITEKVKALVEKRAGRFFYARDMGRKQLAYPIKKQIKGVYTCYDYAAGGNAVSEMERGFRLDDNVLRFLTVVKNEDVDVEARAAEIMARGEDAPKAAGETSEAKAADETKKVADETKKVADETKKASDADRSGEEG